MSELTNNNNPFDSSSSSSSAGGFSFDHVHRNALLQHQLLASASNHNATSSPILPLATKTGTTIVGLVYSNGIVLGADTRATNDTTVADKNCDKIHYIAPNIYCCGAGTAADTEKTTELIASQMELLRLNTGGGAAEHSRVVTACTLLKRLLFRYQGHISAALVLGGCDPIDGPALYQIYPHGSTSKLPYTTMGSGSLAAMAIFESEYRDDLAEDEAVSLVRRAILAGIFNDLGSGSNVDTCVIRTDGSVSMGRNDITPNEVGPLRSMVKRSAVLNIGKGTTPILKSSFVQSKMIGGGVSMADVTVTAMETS